MEEPDDDLEIQKSQVAPKKFIIYHNGQNIEKASFKEARREAKKLLRQDIQLAGVQYLEKTLKENQEKASSEKIEALAEKERKIKNKLLAALPLKKNWMNPPINDELSQDELDNIIKDMPVTDRESYHALTDQEEKNHRLLSHIIRQRKKFEEQKNLYIKAEISSNFSYNQNNLETLKNIKWDKQENCNTCTATLSIFEAEGNDSRDGPLLKEYTLSLEGRMDFDATTTPVTEIINKNQKIYLSYSPNASPIEYPRPSSPVKSHVKYADQYYNERMEVYSAKKINLTLSPSMHIQENPVVRLDKYIEHLEKEVKRPLCFDKENLQNKINCLSNLRENFAGVYRREEKISIEELKNNMSNWKNNTIVRVNNSSPPTNLVIIANHRNLLFKALAPIIKIKTTTEKFIDGLEEELKETVVPMRRPNG